MNRKIVNLLAILFLLICGEGLSAQELQVKDFRRLERDLLARTQERLDLNDEPCAIVRVSVPKTKSFVFEGNVVGEVIYQPGEAIVYMPARSRNLTVKSEEYGLVKYDFPERLEKSVVYELSLKIILSEDQKTRTLVMPVVGVGSTASYGLMVGLVKKTGPYAKVKYNFRAFSSDYEADADGVVDGYSTPSWYTGKSKTSRFAVTAGVLHRIILPVYVYGGLGYGFKKSGWELESGEWAENTAKSYKGLEVEVGGIYRYKNVAASLGVQTTQFQYWEATIGVGIMF